MPWASVTVTLDRDTVVLGEELSGILHVTSERELDMEELRVQITGSARARDLEEDDKHWGKQRLWWILWKVSGPHHLTRGYEQEFPFSVRIPTLPGMNVYGLEYSEQFEDAFGSLSYLEKDERAKRWRKAHELLREGRIEWEIKGIIARKMQIDINSKKMGFEVSMPSSPIPLERPRSRVEDVQTVLCRRCGEPLTPMMRLSGLMECPHCGAGRTIIKLFSLVKQRRLPYLMAKLDIVATRLFDLFAGRGYVSIEAFEGRGFIYGTLEHPFESHVAVELYIGWVMRKGWVRVLWGIIDAIDIVDGVYDGPQDEIRIEFELFYREGGSPDGDEESRIFEFSLVASDYIDDDLIVRDEAHLQRVLNGYLEKTGIPR